MIVSVKFKLTKNQNANFRSSWISSPYIGHIKISSARISAKISHQYDPYNTWNNSITFRYSSADIIRYFWNKIICRTYRTICLPRWTRFIAEPLLRSSLEKGKLRSSHWPFKRYCWQKWVLNKYSIQIKLQNSNY